MWQCLSWNSLALPVTRLPCSSAFPSAHNINPCTLSAWAPMGFQQLRDFCILQKCPQPLFLLWFSLQLAGAFMQTCLQMTKPESGYGRFVGDQDRRCRCYREGLGTPQGNVLFQYYPGKVRLYYSLHLPSEEMKPEGLNICKPTVLKPEQESGSPESSSKSFPCQLCVFYRTH